MAKDLESELVRLVMPDASPKEIAEATARWFEFLRVICLMALKERSLQRDSRVDSDDDRIDLHSRI